jgi:hypothetical protein
VDENKAICSRCGASWAVNTQKRNRRDLKCYSCRMQVSVVIKYGKQKCMPWQGEFDPTLLHPMFDGELFLPGVRTCGHADCVNPNHIKVLGDS